jgi:choline dehydrogenase-like flavoprotein
VPCLATGQSVVLSDIADLPEDRLRCDVCVIGAGAAGITLAMELSESALSVVLLESGGTGIESDTHELCRGRSIGIEHHGMFDGRARRLGGTTTRWAGQALPLQGIDFEARDWVSDSGWPIHPDAVRGFYDRACRVLGIPPFGEAGGRCDGARVRYPPGFDESRLVPLRSRFSPTPDFAKAYALPLRGIARARVVLHANVTEIVTDATGRSVDHVRARSLDGRGVVVAAKAFVVSAGGIETARLLLVSDRHDTGGIGNGMDLVGRYFQDHPGLVVGRVHSADPRRLVRVFRPRRVNGIRHQPLFRISEGLQRSERLLNVGGAVLYGAFGGPNPVSSGKAVVRALRDRRFGREEWATVRSIARRPRPVVGAALGLYLLGRPPIDASLVPVLTVGGEQAPNRDSRVYLSDSVDSLGMRRVNLDWRLTEQETRSWSRFAEVAASEFERTRLGSVELDDLLLPEDPAELSGRIVDAAHHMGTTRMGRSPADGVVDRDCRVFGVENLFVASSSVFPSGGLSNPTLTIIALAIRLADHLKGERRVEPGA